MAMRGVSQANLDKAVLQYTKFIYGVYTCESDGYSVVSMGVPIRHCGRVVLFYRVQSQFSVKALQQFGTNVVRFYLVKGEQQWYILGCYLFPNDASTIECVFVAVGKGPLWSELLVAGNFNTELTGPEGAEQDK